LGLSRGGKGEAQQSRGTEAEGSKENPNQEPKLLAQKETRACGEKKVARTANLEKGKGGTRGRNETDKKHEHRLGG